MSRIPPPPPPPLPGAPGGSSPSVAAAAGGGGGGLTSYATSLSKSMTIHEMRDLNRRATQDAEAKKTELRLVLASRYRELVGSSDEVLHMQARAKELDELVRALPGLAQRLAACAELQSSGAGGACALEGESATPEAAAAAPEEEKTGDTCTGDEVSAVRRSLASLPRHIHRSLDRSDVHGAASGLIELFNLIAARTGDYPLAAALATTTRADAARPAALDPLLQSQMKMIYLHVQTLPDRTVRQSRRLLHRAAGSHPAGPAVGAAMTASALSALDLLDPHRSATSAERRAARLLDVYYDAKARLIRGLLDRLGRTEEAAAAADGGGGGAGGGAGSGATTSATSDETADDVLGRIVNILQNDILLHPYQIFVLRRFQVTEDGQPSPEEEAVMATLPAFDSAVLRIKASNFLATHLPLIRNRAKAVLMNIAGTTAARLGNIRQSLYDKTDGAECRRLLDGNGLCRWDDAVNSIVDFQTVSSHGTQLFSPEKGGTARGGGGPIGTSARRSLRQSQDSSVSDRRFSLWSALFSATFSSLVHSILTSSFHSVHTRVIGTLRSSLAAAPPLRSILPHEAHRNALRIATDLDLALIKVSDDAHELLVHAEEREESEQRLRQSLYVQTCEIMGRLLNELRRMLDNNAQSKMADGCGAEEDATTELIVGRLCHLLKFRLSCLPTLLDSSSSPAVMAAAVGQKSGMISLAELRSSFEIADDDDDGLISVEEAEEAAESAFSGTTFKGAEMVKDTLLLSASSSATSSVLGGVGGGGGGGGINDGTKLPFTRNVTLSELVLLSARGLRHDKSGPKSALGSIQRSLDDIVSICFAKWSRVILSPSLTDFTTVFDRRMVTATTASDKEWRRLNDLLKDGEEAEYRTAIKSKPFEEHPDLNRPPAIMIGNVSAHITAFLLSVASALNQNVCPSDSLPPVPSTDHAQLMGIALPGGGGSDNSIPNMMQIIRGALLEEAVTSITTSLIAMTKGNDASEEGTISNDGAASKPPLMRCSTSALLQLQLDVTFIAHFFFDRNRSGFAVSPSGVPLSVEMEEGSQNALTQLEQLAGDISSHFDRSVVRDPSALRKTMREKHLQTLRSCDLFLSALFGEGESASLSMSALAGAAALSGGGATSSDEQTLLLNPMPSSRRFMLLPIQAERSLDELRLRSKYGKEKEAAAEAEAASAPSSAVTSGFGFFSSMLKKK